MCEGGAFSREPARWNTSLQPVGVGIIRSISWLMMPRRLRIAKIVLTYMNGTKRIPYRQLQSSLTIRNKKSAITHEQACAIAESFLRIFRPTCRHDARHRGGAGRRHEPQPRIMVRSILKRTLALSAWGTPAGIMSISPAATR